MKQINPNTKVIWTPLPGSQTLAISCPANHILYEGSRGPGKTDAQLMAFRSRVGLGYGAHWRGIIFDRQYKNLDDLINKSLRWFPQFRDGARYLRSKGDLKWVWPTGEELYFRQIQKEDDYWNFHGQEYTFIGWNELCKFPTPNLYNTMMSCNRSSFLPLEHSPDPENPLPKIPLVVFSTANPYGPGHSWVKKRFIDIAPAGQLVRVDTPTFNPQTQKNEITSKYQVRLFGSYKENRYLAPEYIAELEKITDPAKRKAWLEGNWDVMAGGALDDIYDANIHVLPRFVVPSSWTIKRAFDWGSTKPFSVGYWAIANGEEATLPDGRIFCPARNSLIRCGEWYGCDPNGDNVGLNLSAKVIAEGTKQVEMNMRSGRWITVNVRPGPADGAIFNKEREGVDSIAMEMAAVGVEWTRANKDPGTRVGGLQLVRDRLENALTGEGPAMYFMDHCRHAIAQLPCLPRDPDDLDDVDSEAEDHIWDETRYMALDAGPLSASSIKVQFAI